MIGANFIGCPELISINVSEGNQKFSSQDGVLYNKDKTRLFVAPEKIENCKIPNTVKDIDKWAFKDCKMLKEIEIPEGVTVIKDRTFEDCIELSNVTLPQSLTRIDMYAFASTKLTGTIIIPENVTYLGHSSFCNCENITKVIIGSKVETITGDDYESRMDTHAFINCSALTEFEVREGNQKYSSQDGILYSKDKSKLILAPYGIVLNNIYIPNGVKEIGDYAFYGCDNITGSLYIPEGVTTIGKQSFSGIDISGEINIPASVNSLSTTAFSNNNKITKITVNENNETYSSQEGILYNKDKSKLLRAPDGLVLNNLVLPEQVKEIEIAAFQGCEGLTGTLTLNEGIEKINDQSFYKCSNLKGTLTIPSTLKKIGYSAFMQCGFEGEVIIPNSVEEIGYQILSGCKGLTKINCKTLSQPTGWTNGWNYGCSAQVVWGYIGE